ncbi:helix-turn-helix domain protein [Kordia sp. SMS9]|uniref:helix-turn-helix domain-containing protein n=1 Tax=Kordia sp. SMS9 TaxID=2282170 RepID=UPI000E0DE0A8|nr:helix-turn-helix domain-containing protein [Kordia sp. SMS9]AXG69189.1 helix-turn-helix domain protein [Kordia sp. SMS9]
MKNAIFLLFLYILTPLFGNSQTTPQSESDSLEKYSFKQIANTYESIRKTNPKLAKIYLDALYPKATKREEKLTAFLKMCHHQILHGTKEKAFSYLESAYDLAKIGKKIELAYVYEKKGYYYYKEKEYDNASNYYFKALAIAELEQNKNLILKIEHKIGALYYTLGELDKALIILNLLYKKVETDTIDYNLRLSIIRSLGNTYLRKYSFYKEQKKLLDSFSFFTQKGLQLAIQEKDLKTIAYFENLSGIHAFIKENYATALTYFNRSIKTNEVTKVQQTLQESYFYKGKTFLRLQQTDSAIYYIKKSEPFFRGASKKLNKPSTYSLLSECYEQKGDLKNAIKYAQLAIAYTEQRYSDNEKTKASIDQKDKIRILQKRIYRLEDALKNISKKKTGWYIFSIILVISLIVGYLFFRRREQKNKASFQKLLEETKENDANIVKKVIPEVQTQQILDALTQFESDHLFLQQNCTLPFLAKKLHTNTAYLSNIINEYKNESYTTYIKKLRVQYSIKRLKDDTRFRAYTIEAIAKECGFKTAKPFSRAFKKVTNIYPSTFIKNLHKIDNQSS